MLYEPRPLNWDFPNADTASVVAPLHTYTVRYSEEERCFVTTYVDHITSKPGTFHNATMREAIAYAEQVHIPSQMLDWFIPILQQGAKNE